MADLRNGSARRTRRRHPEPFAWGQPSSGPRVEHLHRRGLPKPIKLARTTFPCLGLRAVQRYLSSPTSSRLNCRGRVSLNDRFVAVDRQLCAFGYGSSGSIAPIRFLKQRPFDQLFSAWGHQSLSAHFVHFFTAVATTSNVCSALRPVVPDVIFLRHEWPELAETMQKRDFGRISGVPKPLPTPNKLNTARSMRSSLPTPRFAPRFYTASAVSGGSYTLLAE